MKTILKSSVRGTVRTLSYAVPKSLLFQASLRLRYWEMQLRRAGLPTWAQKGADHFFCSLRPAVVESRIWDRRFFVRLNDPCHLTQLICMHEPVVVQWLSEQLKEGMTFLDVGANIGFYTLLAAKRVGESGTVISMEADPDVFAILMQNIQSNSLSNVHALNGAAYRSCDRVRLGRAIASSWYTGLYYQNATQWIEVDSYTLDSLRSRFGIRPIDMVKIDVEGAEAEVLEGMTCILHEDRPKLLVEVHRFHASGEGHPAIQLLRRAGYCIHYIDEDHAVAEPTEKKC
jgi:FkbM family methyltransferase